MVARQLVDRARDGAGRRRPDAPGRPRGAHRDAAPAVMHVPIVAAEPDQPIALIATMTGPGLEPTLLVRWRSARR